MDCRFCKNEVSESSTTLTQMENGDTYTNHFCSIEHLVLHNLINRYGMSEREAHNIVPN